MSNYGNSAKNPPWARSGQGMVQTSAVPQSLMPTPGMLQYPQVFQGQQAALGMNMTGLAQTAVAPMQGAMQASGQYDIGMYGAVSYPTRALNTAAFQTTPQGQQQSGGQPVGGQQGSNKQRVFTGTVTKVQDNFGFVDDEVFFQFSCVKGQYPVVGDKVLVEAVWNANMPYKWNASRIQVISIPQDSSQHSGSRPNNPSASQNYQRSQSNYNAVPPPSKANKGGNAPAVSRFSGGGSRFSNNDRGNRSNAPANRAPSPRREERSEPERKRRREDRERDEKPKSPPRKRSRTPAKTQRRPQRRPPPRYNVTVPKTSLNGKDGDVVEIKKRYTNMYIPSDFFLSEYRWTESFPIGKPMSLDFPCTFHVMHKDVDPIVENNAVLEPPDADYIYSAKVMLLASPGLEELYSKCMTLTEEREGSRSTTDEESLTHPSKLIQFLVGTRGKEHMAIGGPWSPSEDGEDPASDPSVLVHTAIRTTKALTGIDLSECTQWFRFVEVHYHRSETTYRGKSYPARVETVVIYVPDVWSCAPTRLEWDAILLDYQKALDKKLSGDNQKEEEEEEEADTSKDAVESPSAEKVDKRDPKHYSELDPKTMKIVELREELDARNLSAKGLKSQLAARLAKALKTEEEEEKQKGEAEEKQKKETPEKNETEEKKKKEEEEKPKLDEKEKQLLEKRYKLPKKPHIIVHPNRTAKSGKFDCSVVSLTNLLSYRQEDTKEHSFEVSIFAELFNEMLMRDFGFNIFRAIVEAPEKPKEEKKDEKDKPKDEKEKSKDEKEKPKDEKDKSKDEKDKSKDDKDKPKDEKDKIKEEKDKSKDEKSKDGDKDKKVEKDSKGKDSESVKKESKVKEEDIKVKDEEMEAESGNEEQKSDNDRERKERPKLVTNDKMLLLSFTYFDNTRCGYIYDKDIEDLLFSLGLTLSRSQIKKLVTKVVSRDAVYYRRLTDKPESSPPVEHLPLDQLVGNKLILPSFLASKDKNAGVDNDKKEVKKGQIISYNGSLIDIGKIMDQLSRSESTRVETEKSLGKLRDELSKLKDTVSRSERHIKELNVDLRDCKDKLSHTNMELASLQIKEKQYVRALTEINDKVKPLIAKPDPPRSEEKPSKTSEKEVEIKKEPEREIKKEVEKEIKKEVEIKKESVTKKEEKDEKMVVDGEN